MSTATATAAGPSAASPVRQGCRDASGVVVAYVPFAVALGAALAATTVHPLVAWTSSPLLFGGAAQLLAVQLVDAGAGPVVVVVGALVVNARMLLYSASLAPHTRGWPTRWRWAAPFLLADPVYALALGRFTRPDGAGAARARLAYYLSVGLTLWVAWLLLTGAGVLLAGSLPAALPLDLAAPLSFLLLLLPMLTDRPARTAAAVGGIVALVMSGLPLGLGLVAGAAAGVGAGALAAGARDA
jgi:branched chain amino acid efflux pump